MKRITTQGFTLIELLTVIAIIAILAALTFTAGPRLRESAKLTQLDGAFKSQSTALASYYSTNESYPPGYGFLNPQLVGVDPSTWGTNPVYLDDATRYVLKPYTVFTETSAEGNTGDIFATSYDGNGDGIVDGAEYLPIPTKLPDGTVTYETMRWPENGNPTTAQANAESRPLYYAPVNMDQFKRMKRYWLRMHREQNDARAVTLPQDKAAWAGDDDLQYVSFPPPRYDGYALISVGPAENYFGLVAAGAEYQAFLNKVFTDFPDEAYHILALRAFYLATRDLNENGKVDFDYRDRKNAGEAGATYIFKVRDTNGVPQDVNGNNDLPCNAMPKGYGPVLFSMGK